MNHFNIVKKPRFQTESQFQNKVLNRLRDIPDLWVTKVQQVAIRAIPDLLICYKGRFFAWELKRTGKDATVHQQYNLDKINEAGGIARVVTPANFEEALKELYEIV